MAMTLNRRGPLKVMLDSFWQEKIGITKNLCEREIKLVKVDSPINIPPRWPMIAMKHGELCVIPVDVDIERNVMKVLEGLNVKDLFSGRGLQALLNVYDVSQDRGAHWLHLHCDESCFKPYERYNARLLTDEDKRICERWTKKYPRAIGPYSYS